MQKKLVQSSLFVLVFVLLMTSFAEAQRRDDWYMHRGDFDWGAGVRLGDPIGISFRKYVRHGAIDLVLGVPGLLYNDGHPSGAKYERTVNFMAALHYGYRGEIAHNHNTHYTIGLGPLVNSKYTYGNVGERTILKQRSEALWFYGVSGLIGLDYVFPGTDISLFGDFNPAVEFNSELGPAFVPYAGTGLRFLI